MNPLQILSTGLLVGLGCFLFSQILWQRPVLHRLIVLGLMFLLFGSAFPRYDPGGWMQIGGSLLAIVTLTLDGRRQKQKTPTRVGW